MRLGSGAWLAFAVVLAALDARGACPLVTTTADAVSPPAGSLRDCLQRANASVAPQTVTFDPAVFNPGVIALVAPLPALDNPLGVRIDGAGADVTLDGAGVAGAGLTLRGPANQVRNVTVRAVLGGGVGWGAGVRIEEGSVSNTLARVVAADNTGEGVFLAGNNGGTSVTDSTITGNGSCGVSLWTLDGGCAGRVLVARNLVSGNGAALDCGGIHVVGAPCVDVIDNEVTGAETIAIKLTLDTTRQVTVSGNRVHDNPTVCIGVYRGAHDNQVVANVCERNAEEGIAVGDLGTTGNLVAMNVVTHTAAGISGRGWGIHVYPGGDGTRVLHNTVYGNAGHGLVVEASPAAVRFQNNLAAFNAGAGLSSAALADAVLVPNLLFGNGGGPTAGGVAVAGEVVCDPLLAAPDGGDYSPGSCSSCAVERGALLGVDQPDLTKDDDAGLFWGAAPDLGAIESRCRADAGTVDAGAGEEDGGGGDAGASEPRAFLVGCGCGASGPGLELAAFGLLAFFRWVARRHR